MVRGLHGNDATCRSESCVRISAACFPDNSRGCATISSIWPSVDMLAARSGLIFSELGSRPMWGKLDKSRDLDEVEGVGKVAGRSSGGGCDAGELCTGCSNARISELGPDARGELREPAKFVGSAPKFRCGCNTLLDVRNWRDVERL